MTSDQTNGASAPDAADTTLTEPGDASANEQTNRTRPDSFMRLPTDRLTAVAHAMASCARQGDYGRANAEILSLVLDEMARRIRDGSAFSAERHQELLKCIRDLSMDSISTDEATELRGQIAALIAQIGTLRAQLRPGLEPAVTSGDLPADVRVERSPSHTVIACGQTSYNVPAEHRQWLFDGLGAALNGPEIEPSSNTEQLDSQPVDRAYLALAATSMETCALHEILKLPLDSKMSAVIEILHNHGIVLNNPDPDEDLWLAELAQKCRCCSSCTGVPCGGCQQGAGCDALECQCDIDLPWIDEDTGGDW